MKNNIFITLFCLICLEGAVFGQVRSFSLESHYAVPNGEVAEIIAPTPDGSYLFYTNATGKKIGILDISNPQKPIENKAIALSGEPTSLAITKDGKYLVTVRRNDDNVDNAIPSTLSVYSIADKSKPVLLGELTIGVGADSIALATQGSKTIAIVAIEDEETNADGDASLPGKRPGQVDVITLDFTNVAASKISSVQFSEELLKKVAGVNFTADPQPEFIAVNPNQKEFAVTLQENNAVAIISIADPSKPIIKELFCAGTSARKADLKKDGIVSFTDDFIGRREPDGITYLTVDGLSYLALANEGDTSVKTFGDGIQSGGRSVSIHSQYGLCLWDSGLELDTKASLLGHYPDDRSDKRGTEIEGVCFANFWGDALLIAASERGSFLAVYNVNNIQKPVLLDILPTGIGPEGVTTVDGRKDGKKLIVSANEKDGTINIFSASQSEKKPNPTAPQLYSKNFPFGAISGFTTDNTYIYAVPDNACKYSRIWRLNMSSVQKGVIEIDNEIPLTKDGQAVSYDLEGVCWTKDGFWLASEGKTGVENLLIFATLDGKVLNEYAIPAELIKKQGEPKTFGFEGVATSGKYVYAAIQRGFDVPKNQAAIVRFDTQAKTWETAFYPLEQHSKDAKKFWMGLSDITFLNDKTLLVVERDKGMGGTAEVKRIYSIDISQFSDGALLSKKLVSDILKERGMLLEKIESLVIFAGDMWIANDNDGAGWTQVLNISKK